MNSFSVKIIKSFHILLIIVTICFPMAHEAVANGDFVRLKQLHIQQLRFGQLSRGTLLCSHLYIILDLFSMGVPG